MKNGFTIQLKWLILSLLFTSTLYAADGIEGGNKQNSATQIDVNKDIILSPIHNTSYRGKAQMYGWYAFDVPNDTKVTVTFTAPNGSGSWLNIKGMGSKWTAQNSTATLTKRLSAGNYKFFINKYSVATQDITFKVTLEERDTTPPIITLNGDATVTLNVGDSYTDAGAAASDDMDGNVAVITTGSVDTTTAGEYTITYSASDTAGNTSRATRTVTVTKTPTELNTWYNTSIQEQTGKVEATFTATPSAENIDSVIGFSNGEVDAYSDLGIIVRFAANGIIDARNGSSYNATTSINYEANKDYTFRLAIDFNTKKYSIYVTPEGEDEVVIGQNYNFRTEQSSLNSINNMARYSLTNGVVSVGETNFISLDTIPPVITLIGDVTVTLSVGDSYTDAGATAEDNVDGDITENIIIRGDIVDTNVQGNYTVTYDVKDTAGNSAQQVSRNVVVIVNSHGTELIEGGGNENGELDASEWTKIIDQNKQWDLSVGDCLTNEKCIHVNPYAENGGMYQAISTEEGKTYILEAKVLGSNHYTDVNNYTLASSYMTVESSTPTPTSTPEYQTEKVKSNTPQIVKITFTATSQTTYISLRGDTAYKYPTALSISVKRVSISGEKDTTPPEITLNGASTINLKIGDDYEELGATAFDDKDGDVDVNITGNVNTDTEGTYTITYSAIDLAGNNTTKTREVTVSDSNNKSVDYRLNDDTDHESIQLRLPNKIKVIQSKTLKIYLDNIVNVENIQLLNFKFTLNGTEQANYQGVEDENRYIQIAIPEGRSKLRVEVTNTNNSAKASANSEILSFKQDVSIQDAKVLVIGDSFTDGSDYLVPLRYKLDISGQLNKFTFIGLRENSSIRHEGHAGWTARAFMNENSQWYPNSPFLNNEEDIDFSNYFENKLKDIPNIVVIQLGVNDAIAVAKGIKKGYYTIEQVNAQVSYLESLVNGIKQSLPNVTVLIMEPTPPNRQSNNTNGYAAQVYKDVLNSYWEESLNRFENRESENIYVVPGFIDIDPWNGFKDSVHPNDAGYEQLAQTLMGNLLWTVVQNKNTIISKENNIVDDTTPPGELGQKIFEIDFNRHSAGAYTKAMHKEDFYTYKGEDLYYKKNHDGSWMYGADGLNNTSIVEDNNEKVLRVQYDKGHVHPTYGFQSLAALPKSNRPVENVNNPQEVTLVYSVKFEDDFDWAIGGKLPGLAGGLSMAGGQSIGNYYMKNGFTARFMWHILETVSGSKIAGMISYIYHPGRDGKNGQLVYGAGPYMSTAKPTLSFTDHSNDALFQFETNKWYKIRQTIKANRPYKSDGTMKVWINDKLASSFGNMKFIADGMHGKYAVDRFLFSTFYGGSGPGYAPKRDTHALFKEIKVYVK